MIKSNDIQETGDDLNNHPMVAVEDRKMDEISRATQDTLNNGQEAAETAQIGSESKAKTLRLKRWGVPARPIVIDNSADLGGSSLSGSAFFPSTRGIRLFTK